VSVHKLRIKLSVIPRLDRGIYFFQWVMDPPVKPEDDKSWLYGQTLFKILRVNKMDAVFLLIPCPPQRTSDFSLSP
jgi:hypothetical protein